MNILGEVKSFFSQMFSQISHTPNFEQSFKVKRCGLYTGVYGNWLMLEIDQQSTMHVFVMFQFSLDFQLISIIIIWLLLFDYYYLISIIII